MRTSPKQRAGPYDRIKSVLKLRNHNYILKNLTSSIRGYIIIA